LYEAENLLLGKRVAVKWINPAMARRPASPSGCTAKAKEAAGLDHPNIASVLDIGEIDGAPYIVTEPLSGRTLEREIDEAAAPVSPCLRPGPADPSALDMPTPTT
jgi:serine/threonine-protein kinase